MINPIQPVALDNRGVLRFKPNKLVEYLLNNGGIDMNALAVAAQKEGWSTDDRQQFAQLIGYSVSGYGDLGYSDPAVYEAVSRKNNGVNPETARAEYLQATINKLKQQLREPMAELFKLHPDDMP